MERETCTECDKPIMARGMCQLHYHRWYTGRPLHGRTRFTPNEIRARGEIAEMDVYNRSRETAYTTVIDAEDVEQISSFKWGYITKNDRRLWGPYIVRHGKGGGPKTIYLHRFVMGPIPSGHWVDHLDGDTLNNRKSNLRIGTPQENVWNRSELQGVRFQEGRWIAQISRQFRTEKEAIGQRVAWEESRIQ